MDYTVRLSIPDITEDNPVEAVKAFIDLVKGAPDDWQYRVEEQIMGGGTYMVDMADDARVTGLD